MFWRLLCVAQFYCLLAIYTYLGLTPHPENSVPVFNDLLMHFAGYVIAGISISFARPLWPIWQRAVLLIAYSFAIEIGQYFNPPRTFSLSDMLANSGGVLVGLVIVLVLQKYVPVFSKLLYWNTPLVKN
ncbi:VanZ family protein [Cellvibrio sp. pealriver]|uniref:VanZ family protein n=1 Tax=Cellvibrio sp. pealriver TaxID=1622269 RepID=UPI00066FFBB1|nr:VanZ family protein [Cellvibrio sp. pealriver]